MNSSSSNNSYKYLMNAVTSKTEAPLNNSLKTDFGDVYEGFKISSEAFESSQYYKSTINYSNVLMNYSSDPSTLNTSYIADLVLKKDFDSSNFNFEDKILSKLNSNDLNASQNKIQYPCVDCGKFVSSSRNLIRHRMICKVVIAKVIFF